jgi:hypothetical protein
LRTPRRRRGWGGSVSAFPLLKGRQNRKIFFSLIEKNFGGARLKKCGENFFVLPVAVAKRRRAETLGGIQSAKSSGFCSKKVRISSKQYRQLKYMPKETITPPEQLKQKAEAWAPRFDAALKKVIGDDNAGREELNEILWNKGILDRIAPDDNHQDEKNARIKLNKAIWEGKRSDPELYRRIIYAIEESRHTLNTTHSFSPGNGWLYPLNSFFSRNLATIHPDFPAKQLIKFFPEATKDYKVGYNKFLDDLIKRAKQELVNLGEPMPEKIISIGDEGIWKGNKVKVTDLSNKGLITIRGINTKDYFYDELTPVQIYSKNFEITNSEN